MNFVQHGFVLSPRIGEKQMTNKAELIAFIYRRANYQPQNFWQRPEIWARQFAHKEHIFLRDLQRIIYLLDVRDAIFRDACHSLFGLRRYCSENFFKEIEQYFRGDISIDFIDRYFLESALLFDLTVIERILRDKLALAAAYNRTCEVILQQRTWLETGLKLLTCC